MKNPFVTFQKRGNGAYRVEAVLLPQTAEAVSSETVVVIAEVETAEGGGD